MSNLYQKIMGHPWVYDVIRPAFLGGISVGEAYRCLGDTRKSVILDVGCGTGAALDYISDFAEYHGFDTDPEAVQKFRARHGDRPRVHLHDRHLTAADVERIQPNQALFMGVYHHLDDSTVRSILGMLRASISLQQVVSTDVYIGSGLACITSNILARLDRGRHVRKPGEYRQLLAKEGFVVERDFFLRSGNQLASYFVMAARPGPLVKRD